MLTSDILQTTSLFDTIHERCSTFIQTSNNQPLIKSLPNTYTDCHRVKVRTQKPKDYISPTFNEAFDQQTHNIRQRSILANGKRSFISENSSTFEPFYVFPIDGFKFLYNTEVNNSSNNYQSVFDSVLEQFGTKNGNEMLTDVLRFAYTSDNLAEGIASGSEIILYNIPYYYAVRASSVSSYDILLQQ